jgi:hypothetical protein
MSIYSFVKFISKTGIHVFPNRATVCSKSGSTRPAPTQPKGTDQEVRTNRSKQASSGHPGRMSEVPTRGSRQSDVRRRRIRPE